MLSSLVASTIFIVIIFRGNWQKEWVDLWIFRSNIFKHICLAKGIVFGRHWSTQVNHFLIKISLANGTILNLPVADPYPKFWEQPPRDFNQKIDEKVPFLNSFWIARWPSHGDQTCVAGCQTGPNILIHLNAHVKLQSMSAGAKQFEFQIMKSKVLVWDVPQNDASNYRFSENMVWNKQ